MNITFGSFAFLPCADAAEAMALAGIKRVIIDREHASTTWAEAREMIRAVQGAGSQALVRIRAVTSAEVLPALELGVDGIVVPFVSSQDDVEGIRDLCRYPPMGSRGTCSLTRAASYGLKRSSFAEHVQNVNQSLKIIGLLETPLAEAAIGAMMNVLGGLDGILIGRSDLASALGKPGQATDPEVIAISRRMLGQCRAAGIQDAGVVVYGREEVASWVDAGATSIIYGSDVSVLATAYERFVNDSSAVIRQR